MKTKSINVSAAQLPKGRALLCEPHLNKGTAFTAAERDALGLHGLLPPRIFSQDDRARHVIDTIRRIPNDLDKYLYLVGLQDRNERLFYRVLIDNIEELTPIVYTPTVGLACQEYSRIFRRPRGMFITKHDRGRIREILQNWQHKDVRVIVVTDGERILGLGDLGANGMGIPIGKLALYTACAGIDPDLCLPMTIDVGTNNQELLNDSTYIGLQEPRLRGEGYDALLGEFLAAVTERYPKVMIQLEDFGNANAFRLLEQYRDRYCLFDDDIQGTAAVVLAGLYSALRITGGRLTGQRLLFFGAGEAAIGIADLVVSAMVAAGLPEVDARRLCWFVDSKGLIVANRTDLTAHKRPYAHDHQFHPDLLSSVEAVRPTALIGVSGQPNTFTPAVLEAMARINDRPIIFALSNPTSRSECSADTAYRSAGTHAIFASGSPCPVVAADGRTLVSGQANNSYIFPGVGLGVFISEASRVTDEMFTAAARALDEQVTERDLSLGRIYPPLSLIREVSAAIALAVARVAFQRGLAAISEPTDLAGAIESRMYDPVYPVYV